MTLSVEEDGKPGQFNCIPVETDSDVHDVAAGEDFLTFINKNKVNKCVC